MEFLKNNKNLFQRLPKAGMSGRKGDPSGHSPPAITTNYPLREDEADFYFLCRTDVNLISTSLYKNQKKKMSARRGLRDPVCATRSARPVVADSYSTVKYFLMETGVPPSVIPSILISYFPVTSEVWKSSVTFPEVPVTIEGSQRRRSLRSGILSSLA